MVKKLNGTNTIFVLVLFFFNFFFHDYYFIIKKRGCELPMSPKIEVEETNLEDLILLGEDKLIDVLIEYPTADGKVEAKAKIKQLTMKELKNINLQQITGETSIQILEKALYKQDGTAFPRELILNLPMGVVNALGNKILEVSGADQDMGF